MFTVVSAAIFTYTKNFIELILYDSKFIAPTMIFGTTYEQTKQRVRQSLHAYHFPSIKQ